MGFILGYHYIGLGAGLAGGGIFFFLSASLVELIEDLFREHAEKIFLALLWLMAMGVFLLIQFLLSKIWNFKF